MLRASLHCAPCFEHGAHQRKPLHDSRVRWRGRDQVCDRFYESIGVLNSQKDILFSRTAKTSVIKMSNAQCFHHRRIHDKAHKLRQNTLFLGHLLGDTNVTLIDGLGFVVKKFNDIIFSKMCNTTTSIKYTAKYFSNACA